MYFATDFPVTYVTGQYHFKDAACDQLFCACCCNISVESFHGLLVAVENVIITNAVLPNKVLFFVSLIKVKNCHQIHLFLYVERIAPDFGQGFVVRISFAVFFCGAVTLLCRALPFTAGLPVLLLLCRGKYLLPEVRSECI